MSRRYFLGVLLALSFTWSQDVTSDEPRITLLQPPNLALEQNPRFRSGSFSPEAVAADIDQSEMHTYVIHSPV